MGTQLWADIGGAVQRSGVPAPLRAASEGPADSGRPQHGGALQPVQRRHFPVWSHDQLVGHARFLIWPSTYAFLMLYQIHCRKSLC